MKQEKDVNFRDYQRAKEETKFVGKIAIATTIIVGVGCFIFGVITGIALEQ